MAQDELTRDEEIELAQRIMREGIQRDIDAGRKWGRQQQRIVRIRENEDKSNG